MLVILPLRFSSLSMDFPGGSVVKNLPANAGDTSSIPGSGRPPGGGTGNPLHYPCLENSVDRGAWQATSVGSQSQTRLSTHTVSTARRPSLNWIQSLHDASVQSSCTGLFSCPHPHPLCSTHFCSFSFFPLLDTAPTFSPANSYSSLSLSSQRALW